MIDRTILMRRAIKWVCDEHGLQLDSFRQMDSKTKVRFEDLVLSVSDDMHYNQLKYFRPFRHQMEFFQTGKFSRRGILAANRIGKTVSTCYETAYHLTGRYPEWWPVDGHRFDGPITAFVAGEGWEQVARVLQDELMGTKDIKIKDNIGTGAIPRECIIIETMRVDGANVMGVEIKHISGQRSYLLFGNYTQEVRNLQGFKINLAVFDEQPPDDIYSELVTRTATTQGHVLCSFTPLKGLNGLVSKFWYGEDGYQHIRVSWNDVPEYDPWGEPFLLKETRLQLERDYLPHEREARIAGIPVMGLGAVFQMKSWPTYNTGEVKFKEIIGIHRIIALDLGLIRDRTVISYMFWHPDTKEAWLHSQIVVKGQEEANPLNYVQHLIRPEVFGCPIVLPPDAGTVGRYTMNSQSLRQFLTEYELNLIDSPVHNPPGPDKKITNHKSYGINVMRQMLETGQLRINSNCQDFIREASNYYVDEKGRFSDPDDCIDSARYALLGCLNGWTEPYDKLSPKQRFQQYRQMYRKEDMSNKPSWKQVYNADG